MTANSSDERAKKPKIAEGEEQQGDGLAHKMENGHVNKTPIDDEKEKKKKEEEIEKEKQKTIDEWKKKLPEEQEQVLISMLTSNDTEGLRYFLLLFFVLKA